MAFENLIRFRANTQIQRALFCFSEDLLFSSSSAAADFVLGYSVSGPGTWKDKNGKTLKEIETEKNE